jgi:hypothetical protein
MSNYSFLFLRTRLFFNVQKITQTFERFGGFPSFNCGAILGIGEDKASLSIVAGASQRDLIRKTQRKLWYNITANHPDAISAEGSRDLAIGTPFPFSSEDFVSFSISPSGRKIVIVRAAAAKVPSPDKKQDFFLEVWVDGKFSRSFATTGKHKQIYSKDDTFGCLQWNASETRILYAAEKKQPEKPTYWNDQVPGAPGADAAKGKEETLPQGRKFDVFDSWGEGHVDIFESQLFILDTTTSSIVNALEVVFLINYLLFFMEGIYSNVFVFFLFLTGLLRIK